VADDGSLHVDGGVLDNLPVQLMRQVGPGRIVTVNVSPYQHMVLSGEGARSPDWLHALRGLTRSNARASFPNIVKILYRTAIVTSLGVQSAARASSDLYIEPDVTSVGLADYDRILEVVEAGYVAARQVLAAANVFTDH
jgi:predicted acylesterase/phospholipase RssA